MVDYIVGVENILPGKVFTGEEARAFYKADNFPNGIVFLDPQTGEAPIGSALSETPYVIAATDTREWREQLSKKVERKTFCPPYQLE